MIKLNDGVLQKLIPMAIMYLVKMNMDTVEPFVLLTMMLRHRDQLLSLPYQEFFHPSDSNEGNQKSKYLQKYVKRLDMGKHSFILVITIYYIHYDCGLPLRTRIFFKSQ